MDMYSISFLWNTYIQQVTKVTQIISSVIFKNNIITYIFEIITTIIFI
jgi:hypothetical protein